MSAGGALSARSVLLVGAGGIGNPAALVLALAGVGRLVLADEDEVEASNLHRQFLYTETDIGQPKTAALAAALVRVAPAVAIERVGRALPETVRAMVAEVDLVLDGTDNFASRFLLADACALGGRPVIHAAAIRWTGTVTVVGAHAKPCYRCFFEDLPSGEAPSCATAGVVGPLCGIIGGVAADEALRLLVGDERGVSTITRFDAKTARFRRSRFTARASCPLCGDRRDIATIDRSRYTAAPMCGV